MIEVKNLTAGYHGRAVIQNVSLAFEPGEVLVLLGPNGSGKSTLLRAALGLIPKMDGEILYDGTPLEQLPRKEAARKATFLAQSRSVPNITALRMVLHGRFPHLGYPRRYTRQDYAIAHAAMEKAGCAELSDRSLTELSGGERQRVYLAMALAQETKALFLDEPTAYLDVAHQLQLMETARSLAAEGRAVVLVLHDIPLALAGADRVALLRGGELIACDRPERLYESGAVAEVFGVGIHAVDTPDGRHYYCTQEVR